MSDVFYEGHDLEALAEMPNYYRWIMDCFSQYVCGRVIEYGAGVGTVSAYLRPLARHLTLVEPSPGLFEALKGKFSGAPDVDVVAATLEQHAATVADASIDTIIIVNVLEHIEDDRAAMAELGRMLRPGARLLIFVPALELLMSRLDRDHGHFRRYHSRDIRARISDANLEVQMIRYFDILGVAPWFILNTLLGTTGFNPRLVRLYDRVGIPVTRALETRMSPPFGKNIIAVGRKPDH